jgi:hypothetical protein
MLRGLAQRAPCLAPPAQLALRVGTGATSRHERCAQARSPRRRAHWSVTPLHVHLLHVTASTHDTRSKHLKARNHPVPLFLYSFFRISLLVQPP